MAIPWHIFRSDTSRDNDKTGRQEALEVMCSVLHY